MHMYFYVGGGDAFMIPRFKTKNGYTAYINGDICSWNIRPYTLQIKMSLRSKLILLLHWVRK